MKASGPERSVGQVETRRVKIDLPPEGLALQNGERLPELEVAYETYGALAPDGANAVYICHALTGDAHVAGYHPSEESKPGWWDAMVGPGKGIDTDRFFVVCSNILGGCKGTTGPSSLDPRTGKPYGSRFPSISAADMVKVQYLLLRQLGIQRLAAVVGGSFGGMLVLQWGISYPEMVDRCVCIASALSLSTQALAFDIVGRNAILSDPAWEGGDYYGANQTPVAGLAQARMIGHITYLSSENMERKFGREKKKVDFPLPRFATPFQVESYLDHQGEKFISRFDANSYLHITEAMDLFDLTEHVADPAEIFRQIRPRTRFLVVALSSDWLFPPEQSLEITSALIRAGRHVTYCLLKSPYGHDAFLVEIEHLAEVIRSFLEEPDRKACASESVVAASDARTDNRLICDWIPAGARVLDLGCGDGELLCELQARKQTGGLGMDIDLKHVINVSRKGLDIVQCDLDAGLSMIPDGVYDAAVLSQTLQVVRKPRFVLNEMLRVAREAILVFPNFGNWRHRLRLGLLGRMPISSSLPFEWYDTPNIHLSTLKDFQRLCEQDGLRIVEMMPLGTSSIDVFANAIGLRNLGADRVLIRLRRESRDY